MYWKFNLGTIPIVSLSIIFNLWRVSQQEGWLTFCLFWRHLWILLYSIFHLGSCRCFWIFSLSSPLQICQALWRECTSLRHPKNTKVHPIIEDYSKTWWYVLCAVLVVGIYFCDSQFFLAFHKGNIVTSWGIRLWFQNISWEDYEEESCETFGITEQFSMSELYWHYNLCAIMQFTLRCMLWRNFCYDLRFWHNFSHNVMYVMLYHMMTYVMT